MLLSIVTPPAEEPISLAEAKEHLRIDFADDDALISAYLTAAREYCELVSRRAFVTQTLALRLYEWPDGDCVILPRPPLASVTSIGYTDSNGDGATMSADDYVVFADGEPGRLWLAYGASWPSVTLQPGPSIVITYDAGYGDAADVPERYKQAIRLILGHFHENREEVVSVAGVNPATVPMAAMSLLLIDRGSY